MTPPTHRRFARCLVSHALVCVVLTLVAFSPSALAGTIVNVTGSGSLSISTTGTLYFDAVDLEATDIVLEGQEILIGSPFPSGLPGSPTSTIELRDAIGDQSLSFLGDVLVDTLDYTGSIEFRGRVVHVSSGLEASGSIVLNAGDVSIVNGAFPVGDLRLGCGPTAGGFSTHVGPVSEGDCPVEVIEPPPGGIVIGGEKGGLQPVPEPASVLLFAVGGVVLLGRKPKR